MGQNLYQDAIAEARQLREMAEQNAKNVIIDAVTPRIRTLIEQQLVEGESEETELVPDEMMPDADAAADAAPVSIGSAGGDDSGETAVRVGSDGDIEIEVGGVSISLDTSDEGSAEAPASEPAGDEDVLLDDAVAEALARVVASSNSSRKKIRSQIRLLERRVLSLIHI